MGRSNYNIHFLTTADLSALQRTTREINASALATGAVEKFNQRLAQYEYDRLSTAEKINRLKRDEQALLLAGRQRFEAGDEAGSAQLNTAALEARMKVEALVSQQKVEQARLEQDRMATEKVAAAESARLARERQQRIDSLRVKVARLDQQERLEAFNKLPIEQRLVLLKEREHRLQELINLATQRGSEARRLSLRVSQQQVQADLRSLEAQQRSARAGGGGFLGRIGGGLAARFGPAALAGLVGFKLTNEAREVTQMAESVTDLSARLQTTVERTQAFTYAAGKSGVTGEELGITFKSIARQQAQALAGNEKIMASFTRFGLTAQDLRSLAPDELFLKMATNAGPSGAATARVSDAIRTMGDSADKVFAAMRSGFAGSVREIEELGGVVDAAAIKQLDDQAKRMELRGILIRKQLAQSGGALDISQLVDNTKTYSTALAVGFGDGFKAFRDEVLGKGGSLYQGILSAWAAAAKTFSMADGDVKKPKTDAQQKADAESAVRHTEGEFNRALATVDAHNALPGAFSDEEKAEALREVDKLGKELFNRQKKLDDLNADPAERAKAARRNEAQGKLDDLLKQEAFDALPSAEKLKQLEQERLEVVRQIADAKAAEDPEGQLELERRRLELDQSIKSAKSEVETNLLATRGTSADQLQRIGVFRGGRAQTDKQVSLLTQQLQHLRAIDRARTQTQPVRIVR